METAIQDAQEQEYSFPYHYISSMPSEGFSQHIVDTWGINYVSTIEFILDAIYRENVKSVLDIGCGDGRLSREIKLAFPNCTVTGVDYSQRAISLAKAMNQDHPEIDFFCLDIISEKIDKKYDAAILMEVFEHIPPDKTNEFLKGVRSCLRDDGILFLTAPHINKPVEYKHFQHFSFGSLSRQLESHFNVVEMLPFEKMGIARRILDRILCNRLFVLSNKKILKFLYVFYKRYLFYCETEDQCQRIFVKARPKPL